MELTPYLLMFRSGATEKLLLSPDAYEALCQSLKKIKDVTKPVIFLMPDGGGFVDLTQVSALLPAPPDEGADLDLPAELIARYGYKLAAIAADTILEKNLTIAEGADLTPIAERLSLAIRREIERFNSFEEEGFDDGEDYS